MNRPSIQEWLALPEETRKNIFAQTAFQKKLSEQALEKDWWVVHTISMLFSMSCADHLIFKGGTSLSKGWNIIQRFSEDIDLVIDSGFLGFSGNINSRGIKNLRKATKKYIVETLVPELQKKFVDFALEPLIIKPRYFESSGQDPMIIELFYPKLFEPNNYFKPDLLIEIGSRSLFEPYTNTSIRSFIAEIYPKNTFSDKPITIKTANIERTFLEKIFLLHEEFQKPADKIRVERMSRHLYDIEKLIHHPLTKKAFKSPELFNTIVNHRRKYTSLQEVNYDNHKPELIKFIPPIEQIMEWEADYKQMLENMIYGEALSFKELIAKLTDLQKQINTIQWK